MEENTIKPLLLIFPFDLLSHYLRCLMLARHFSSCFEIRFAHSERYADFITQEGYQTFYCKSFDAQEVMTGAKNFDFSWINEEALTTVYLDQVRNIKIFQPFAVLGDTSLTLKMAAEKTGITYISLMNGYMSKYYAFSRKISRTHPFYKYVNLLSGQVLDLVTEKGEALAFYKLHRPFKKIRLEYNLLKKISYLDELEGDINLICDLPVMFPQNPLSANYTLIAPLYYDTEIIYSQIKSRLDKNKKTIFVTMGSTGDWEKVTFLNNPWFAKYNIVTAGDSAFILNADHIINTAFINIHEIFNVTDLVICQGGNGSIYQSLLYGIPLLCKTNNFEQEWNVEALIRLNAGASLDGIETPGDCINLVESWIEKKNFNLKELLQTQIKMQSGNLATVIRKIATGLLQSTATDLQLL